jgi:hypothetical protein
MGLLNKRQLDWIWRKTDLDMPKGTWSWRDAIDLLNLKSSDIELQFNGSAKSLEFITLVINYKVPLSYSL